MTVSKAFLGSRPQDGLSEQTKLKTIRDIPRDFAEMSRLVLCSGLLTDALHEVVNEHDTSSSSVIFVLYYV